MVLESRTSERIASPNEDFMLLKTGLVIPLLSLGSHLLRLSPVVDWDEVQVKVRCSLYLEYLTLEEFGAMMIRKIVEGLYFLLAL